ncbi:ubx domain containing protein [Grosmannia clavigera kw1407]|uniref:Ubx domain containing protein n=1 Tax=Grosmannia clavigera (strain kw1407 / UAMH 11150) TaxID=655863 RepID=F0XBP2_GROCL|nr:ubx domain containing protein [Grosmannia clavigera kw1407]EFX04864.1 ubx domain containing protein [Grosmannia clavigera kw1407]
MATPASSAAAQLSPQEQESLDQLVSITNQTQAEAVGLLRRSNWSVPVAIAKFFDGEQEQIPLEPLPPRPNGRRAAQPSLQDQLLQAEYNGRQVQPVERTEAARRVVPSPPTPIWRPPLLVALFLSPLHLSYRVLVGLWSAVQYLSSFVPSLRRRLGSGSGSGPGTGSGTGTGTGPSQRLGRRQLSPRDAAARFRREFEEQYGSKALPFAEDGYAQVYDRAKAEPKYLLVVLLSPEHDDTDRFVRETLLSPEVTAIVADPANNFVIWGGNVRDAEAFQVSAEFQATRFPFSAVVCVTPKEGGSTRMGTIKRMTGPIPAQLYAAHLRGTMQRYADDLAAVRADRVDRESSRNLRAEQDSAYERSLAADRERARQRQAAEAAAAERERMLCQQEAEAARQVKLARQWRRWRQAQLLPEPAAGTAGVVRVALKLPESCGGERVRRAFDQDVPVEELPQGYTHEYKFRIASMLPREVHEPSESKTMLEAIGKSASLVVEEVEDEEEEDEDHDLDG